MLYYYYVIIYSHPPRNLTKTTTKSREKTAPIKRVSINDEKISIIIIQLKIELYYNICIFYSRFYRTMSNI